MTPNLQFNLDIEPTMFMWNGQAITMPGTYVLVPDHEIKHLRKRVVAIALHERKRIPFYGVLIGQARDSTSKNKSVWFIEDDRGYVIKSQQPAVV